MVENQRICILPVNEQSTHLFYDTRVVISVPMEEPIVWKVSKVETNNPKGVLHITFAQDRWNEHSDAFEYEHEAGKDDFSPIYDSTRKVIGMYADYYESGLEPEDPNSSTTTGIYGDIIYSAQPQVKIGGSYKKFTIVLYQNGVEIPYSTTAYAGTWDFFIGGTSCSSLVTTTITDNVLKVKFTGNDSYTGQVMTITYTTTSGIVTTLDTILTGL